MVTAIKTERMDLVTFEVVRKSLFAVVNEASTLVERVAYHPIVALGRDRSSALVTPDGRLISHGHSDAAPHYGTFEEGLKALLKEIPLSEMQPRDVYIFNDPHKAGTHVNDVRLIRPIFYGGEIFAFTIQLSHWPDVGGPLPGSFNPKATECYAEGLRLPPLKLYENDEPVKGIFNLIRLNIRAAVERMGDITAKFEAGKLAERRLTELLDKYGVQTVKATIEEFFDYSERVLRSDVEKLPDGTYKFEDFGDMDIMHPDKPSICVRCTLTKKGDSLHFDYSESDPQPRSSWGFTRPSLLSANYLGVMCCFPHLFPLNHGVIRSLKITSKPGTCVDVIEPAAVSGYCSGAFDKVTSVTMACLAQPFSISNPDRIYGGTVSLTNLCIGGLHPKKKRPYVAYIFAIGGGGARTFKDGNSFYFFLFAAKAKNVPLEIEERWFPILFTRYAASQDSFGDGKYRGGCGLTREFKLWGTGTLTIHGDREKFGTYGIGGGSNGGPASLFLNKGTPSEQDLGMAATGITVQPGDVLTYGSSGGGGYGNPLERDPSLVLEDVIDGYMSFQKARETYGVEIIVLDEDTLDYQIDWDKTKKLREGLAKKPVVRGFGPFQVHPLGEAIQIQPQFAAAGLQIPTGERLKVKT